MKIILSIYPVYAEAILNGMKKYEFRKNLAAQEVDTIILYATAPVSAVVGEVTVAGKLRGDTYSFWDVVKEGAGIAISDYFRYFIECRTACAYKLGEATRYTEPKPLADYGIERAPQSFAYVSPMR